MSILNSQFTPFLSFPLVSTGLFSMSVSLFLLCKYNCVYQYEVFLVAQLVKKPPAI